MELLSSMIEPNWEENQGIDSDEFLSEQDAINQYLNDLGLKQHWTDDDGVGDGNCLFRALSFQLYGSENYYMGLREHATRTMTDNEDFYAPFFQKSASNVLSIDLLSQNGTHAGQESMLALSEAMGISFLITMTNEQNRAITVLINHPSNAASCTNNHVHLTYSQWGGGHYEPVVPSTNVLHPSPPYKFPPHGIKTCFIFSEFSSIINLTRNSDNIHPPNSEHSYSSCPSHDESATSDHKYFSSSSSPLSKVKGFSNSTKRKLCVKCKKSFSSQKSLKRHVLRFHSGREPKSNFTGCPAANCKESFKLISHLLDHLAITHGSKIERQVLQFDSVHDFLHFRHREETINNFQFKKPRKERQQKSGCLTFQLVCFRDGKDCTKSPSSRKRLPRKKGSRRMNFFCPCRMFVKKFPSNKVSVTYIKTHSHPISFEQSKYMTLPSQVTTEIQMKLALNVPIDTILLSVRNEISEENVQERLTNSQSQYLLDRRAIMNIKRKMEQAIEIHQDDAESVEHRVNSLRQDDFDPVLVYKSKGSISMNFPALNTDDFMLALMTKEQKEMFEKYAPTVVCVDSVHNISANDYTLKTVIVADKSRTGYPVAFCISNKETIGGMKTFLAAIKEKCPMVTLKSLMTDDDDDQGWEAASSVYGNINHYICSQHILSSWAKKICKLPEDIKEEMLSYLKDMVYSKSFAAFNASKYNFLKTFTHKQSEFVKYFQMNCESRQKKWAHCFRTADYTFADSDTFVGSFHTQLKKLYYDQKHERTDRLIDTLLLIEKHMYTRQFQNILHCAGDSQQTDQRHADSYDIDDSQIKQINEKTFFVQTSKKDKAHTVFKTTDVCLLPRTQCSVTCNELPCINLCLHLYKCTCLDFMSKNQLCKHIHKVHNLQCRNTSAPDHDPEETDLLSFSPLNAIDEHNDSALSADDTKHCIVNLLHEIEQQIVSNESIPYARLQSACAELKALKAANDAASLSQSIPLLQHNDEL